MPDVSMGTVVKLGNHAAGTVAARRSLGRRPRSRAALVLGGGGFTGAIYQIGALRALDLLSVNHTVTDFDVVVGTSAGSFVGALVANGVTPAEMMRVVDGQRQPGLPDVGLSDLLRLNLVEFGLAAAKLPLHLAGLVRRAGRHFRSFSAVDLAIGLADALPSGVYRGDGLERYMAGVLSEPGRTDDFRELRGRLYIAATDLDACRRIVLGGEGWDDVPISAAVRASAALPMVYAPHRLKGRELVDGGLMSTTNVDLAVDAGARLVVIVNPLVPFVNDLSKEIRTPLGARPRHVSDMGVGKIGYQAFKLLAHQRLEEAAEGWSERYPGVDFVLIEPEPDDELMFETSILDYTARLEVARHGFRSVTLKLAADYEHLRDLCARHGIEISATRVRKVVSQISGEEPERSRAWRRILEQTTATLLRQAAG